MDGWIVCGFPNIHRKRGKNVEQARGSVVRSRYPDILPFDYLHQPRLILMRDTQEIDAMMEG